MGSASTRPAASASATVSTGSFGRPDVTRSSTVRRASEKVSTAMRVSYYPPGRYPPFCISF
jgi:hypothetical protein